MQDRKQNKSAAVWIAVGVLSLFVHLIQIGEPVPVQKEQRRFIDPAVGTWRHPFEKDKFLENDFTGPIELLLAIDANGNCVYRCRLKAGGPFPRGWDADEFTVLKGTYDFESREIPLEAEGATYPVEIIRISDECLEIRIPDENAVLKFARWEPERNELIEHPEKLVGHWGPMRDPDLIIDDPFQWAGLHLIFTKNNLFELKDYSYREATDETPTEQNIVPLTQGRYRLENVFFYSEDVFQTPKPGRTKLIGETLVFEFPNGLVFRLHRHD